MIEDYLKQTATWKKIVSVGGYPPTPQEPGTSIKARWEEKRRLVRNAKGQEVVSEARAFCLEAVQPGDVLNYNGRDWIVIAVSEAVDLGGTIRYREVAV